MERRSEGPRDASRGEEPPRTPYRAPQLHRLGLAAALTAAVSMQGTMDGFMGQRTG